MMQHRRFVCLVIVVQLKDGRLMAMGRTGHIEGHLTQSHSADEGRT